MDILLYPNLYRHCPSDYDIHVDLDEDIHTVEMMVGIDTADTAVVEDVVDTLVEGTEENMPLVGEDGMPAVDIEDEENEMMPNDYSSLYHFYCNLVGVVACLLNDMVAYWNTLARLVYLVWLVKNAAVNDEYYSRTKDGVGQTSLYHSLSH